MNKKKNNYLHMNCNQMSHRTQGFLLYYSMMSYMCYSRHLYKIHYMKQENTQHWHDIHFRTLSYMYLNRHYIHCCLL